MSGERAVALAGLVVVAALGAAGCGATAVPFTPPPTEQPYIRTVPRPTDCSDQLTDAAAAQRSLDTARPGDRLCVFGRYLRGASLRLERSGTAQAPIQLLSDGTDFGGLKIHADNVVVDGFNTVGGSGIKASGANITIRNNDVRGAADDGIRCSPCTGAVIENNAVRDADGTGVLISGQRDTVRGNDIAGSRRRAATDADGVRFYGAYHRIEHNNVHDISKAGYPLGKEPRPDCFQTSDADGPPTYGVVIENNTCANVDAQCLAAVGADRRGGGVPSGATAIEFRNNYCQTGAAQAIGLEGYPDVLVKGNTFAAAYEAAVLGRRGAADLTFAGNVLLGNFRAADLDDTSRRGFSELDNKRK